MCNFISWVELPDGTLAYLTDADVYSRHGRKVLQDCIDNDFLGHGAIRRFFGLGKKGIDREQRDFWETDKLPQELAEKVKQFDKYWGRMWREGVFQNDDLADIIRHAPDPWRRKACQQLLRQNPSNGDLGNIIVYGLDPWKEKAWRLFELNASGVNLAYVIIGASDPWKGKACQQLLQQNPSEADLIVITKYCPEPWKTKAHEELDKRRVKQETGK